MIQLGNVMNKTQKTFLAEKKWYVILIGISVVGLVLTTLFTIFTPKETIIPKTDFVITNNGGDQTRFKNIRFTGEVPEAKPKYPLATISPSTITAEYLKDQLIKEHSLKIVPDVPGLWKGEKFTLSYNTQDDSYLFYSNFSPKDNLISETNKATKVAQDFVKTVFNSLPLTMYKGGIKRFYGIGELREVSFGETTIIEVPFIYTINNIPLFLEHQKQAAISVLINSDYEVQKIVFQDKFIYPLLTEKNLTTIPINEAIDNINNRQEASIISAYNKETGTISLKEIESGDLTSVTIEYRADLNQKIAYPFYHFVGKLFSNEGKIIDAEIITPAVKVE